MTIIKSFIGLCAFLIIGLAVMQTGRHDDISTYLLAGFFVFFLFGFFIKRFMKIAALILIVGIILSSIYLVKL